MPDASRRPVQQRRSSDPRIDDLLDMVRAFTSKLDRLDDRIDQLREEEAARRVSEVELLRRITLSEKHHETQDKRIGDIEDDGLKLRAEMRGAVAITTVIASIASILVALHALGVIP